MEIQHMEFCWMLSIKIIGCSTCSEIIIFEVTINATKFEIFINFFFVANEINFTFENVKWYFPVFYIFILYFDSEEIKFGNSLDGKTFICWFCCLPYIPEKF